ncbi:hypothetical protein L596_008280 [Steinernema carpocapsae]|uniref:S phase cyclin A-associated protein in the endoplasmic reticulum N-terminal domain-containing protein n=1 Tax=Steinernema carpocapsae TaxID=34508 RepID=A0A4U5PC31_STECR|nr:hypothetical protein L596_008280 [Steinernema carpocapsae]
MKRKTRRRAQKQARQWTYYVEALKRSLDSLYEICRNEKNVSACREVMLYLTKGNRDFEALIESFVVENDFENGTKPQYAAWEIRQTAGVIEARGSETESSCSMISTDSLIDIMPYSPVLISDTIKKVTESLEKCDPDGGNEWQLVQSRRSRRYSSDSMGSYTTQVGDAEPEQKELDVYERLASSRSSRSCKKGAGASPLSHPNSELSNSRKTYTTGRLLFPKSAMDLPQTRSSMAKIAYSRRILWEQHRSILAEKMRKRHRQEHSRVNLQRPSSSQSNHETKMSSSNRQSSPLRAKSTISLELESIHEANEDEPLPTTRSEPAKEILASLDDDEEWRALTVEEESLAQEEMSLKKEIEEEESTSVDAELRRQVEAEAARVEALEKENAEPSRKRSTQVEKMSWKEALEKCTAKLQRHGISKWNDAVSKKIANFRPPGAVVQMHEKLMLPSRKRCGNNNTSNVEEKLQRAETMRQQLLEAKSFRLKELLKKVEQVKEKQTELVEKKRLLLEDLTLKMEKAEQNRQKTLNEIIRKAHDGDQKILEANFIKNMEENSVRMLMELREGEVEARKQQLEEERLKKSEQNAAVRFAAEKRREKQNEERSKQLQLLAERKRERQAQVDAQRQEAERTRQEQLREKHEKHQKRLATLKANQISDSQKLLNEITRKQEECAKRHEESLEVVKKRAIDSAQGCHSNRSSAVSTYSDEHSESSDTFALQFANPPSMERREGSLVMCKTCGSEMFTDLDTVAHAIFSDICPNSISNFGNASRIELECFQVDSVPETPRVIPIEPASQSIKKKRSKLRAKLSELYDAISSSFTKQNESSVPRRKGPRILSTKSMNLLAGFAKSVEENADSRLFSDTDLQSLLKAANEISIALVKAAKENPSQKQVAADLWHGGIVLQLVKLLLHFRFSPQVSFCSKAFEVVHSVISHIPLLACSLLYSPTYIRFMDCVSGVVKELSETPSKCSDELSELHTSLANLVSFNAILRSNSQHILISSSPTVSLDSIKEANANCVRYFSTLGFYAYLANYAQSVISSSTDFNRTEILFSLDSLIFFNCFHPDSPQFEFAIDSDSTKTLVFLLFQELISVIYRFIPQIPDSSSTSTVIPKSTSEEPDFHAFLQPLFASFIAIDKCLGKEKLSNLLKLEQPATAVQLLHILKMVAQNCLKPLTSQSKRSAEKLERSSSLSNFKLCMESLCRFITLGPEFQKLCSLGHENSLLYILATLDLPFYSNFALQRITAPPILALLCNNDENMQIFNKEISTDFWSIF